MNFTASELKEQVPWQMRESRISYSKTRAMESEHGYIKDSYDGTLLLSLKLYGCTSYLFLFTLAQQLQKFFFPGMRVNHPTSKFFDSSLSIYIWSPA